jgi:octaprenyl-diphosphate synthase
MNPILKNTIKKDIKSVDETLSKLIKPDSKLSFDVYKQVVESGKRLRPLIVLYSALALNYNEKSKALILGSIIELIHTASLLHDDIIDDAQYRRGRDAANIVFGTKPAVLGGDYLYSLAYNMVLDFDLDIARIISKAAYLLAEGEIKEIENAYNVSVTFDDYYDVIYKKTAILIEASSVSGSILADKQYRKNFEEYGKNLGFAFQIKDDCLDYEADFKLLGKDMGIDLKEGKITMPVLFAIESDHSIRDKIDEYFKIKDEKLLSELIEQIKDKGLKPSIEKAIEFANKAKESISFLDKGRYKDYLFAIADYAIERKK